MLFESIMESEILEMMIMEIHALNPPKKTKVEIKIFPNFWGIRIE